MTITDTLRWNDREQVLKWMVVVQQGHISPEHHARFQAACLRLDTAGEGFEIDLAAHPAQVAEIAPSRPRGWRPLAGEILFYLTLVAVMGYGLALVTGVLYTHESDLLRRWHMRIVMSRGAA